MGVAIRHSRVCVPSPKLGKPQETQKNKMDKTRVWCYTCFTEEEPNVDTQSIIYQIHQLEQCPDTGKPHWQGIVRFTSPRYFNGVKKYLGDPTAHIEKTRNEQQSIAYCTKTETQLEPPKIYGTIPIVREPGWWQNLSDAELWQSDPTFMLRHHGGVTAYRRTVRRQSISRHTPTVWILYGPPGTGKSHGARVIGGHDYYAKPSGPWWDGYNGHNTVIFDDFYGSESYGDILRWCSELAINVPIKGSMVALTTERFIFTTNAKPTDIWRNIPDKRAFWRRVTRLIRCELHGWFFENKDNI